MLQVPPTCLLPGSGTIEAAALEDGRLYRERNNLRNMVNKLLTENHSLRKQQENLEQQVKELGGEVSESKQPENKPPRLDPQHFKAESRDSSSVSLSMQPWMTSVQYPELQ